jgi:hypothetical protein
LGGTSPTGFGPARRGVAPQSARLADFLFVLRRKGDAIIIVTRFSVGFEGGIGRSIGYRLVVGARAVLAAAWPGQECSSVGIGAGASAAANCVGFLGSSKSGIAWDGDVAGCTVGRSANTSVVFSRSSIGSSLLSRPLSSSFIFSSPSTVVLQDGLVDYHRDGPCGSAALSVAVVSFG